MYIYKYTKSQKKNINKKPKISNFFQSETFLNMNCESHAILYFLRKYTKYSLESRLHFRIHAAKLDLQYKMGMQEDDSSLGELTPPDNPSTPMDKKAKKLQIEKDLGDMDLKERL